MLHVYNGILLSHKKRWNWVICSEVDETVIQSEVSQKEKQIPYANAYTWNLKTKKNGTDEPSGRAGIKT